MKRSKLQYYGLLIAVVGTVLVVVGETYTTVVRGDEFDIATVCIMISVSGVLYVRQKRAKASGNCSSERTNAA